MRREFADYLMGKGVIGEEALQRLADDGWNIRDPIGLLAYAHGLLPVESIDEVLTTQKDLDLRFGETAVRMGLLSDQQVEVLLLIQQYRSALELGEALALKGELGFDQVMRAFHDFWSEKFQTAQAS